MTCIDAVDVLPPDASVARLSRLSVDCPGDLALRCRPLFRRADLCAGAWALLDVQVPSMLGLLKAMLFKKNCTASGLHFDELRDLLRCVVSANAGFCETQRPLGQAHLECTQTVGLTVTI